MTSEVWMLMFDIQSADLSFFIVRQHTAADARYWYSNSVRLSVCPSVCLSVRDTLVLYEIMDIFSTEYEVFGTQ